MNSVDSSPFDVLVIGGGAAGLMAAIEAGRRGRKVCLVEHQERVGKKIAISGGGRCNFTNLYASADRYLSETPDFCRSALARFGPEKFLDRVRAHGIAWHEKKLGQLFCDISSKQVIGMLLDHCLEAGVRILCRCEVEDVSKRDLFEVRTSQGMLRARALVVATGGLSLPKLGATDFGHRLAGRFGHRVTALRPGLVPLLLQDGELTALSGVSLPVRAHAGRASFEENLLVTHRGLSGPAILQISSHAGETGRIELDLLPGVDAGACLVEDHQTQRTLAQWLGERVPQRFADFWASRHDDGRPLNRHKRARLQELGRLMNRWPVDYQGTEGYATAEVTVGGVSGREISSKTMESRRVPGLFFVGEVVDVTGWLGGYNFQWAWASGHAAGQAV